MREFNVALGQFAQALRAHHRQVNRYRQRAQGMVGADVGGGALAPDMLLAGRQRQAERAPPVAVAGLAHQSSRHLTHVRRPCRQKSYTGTAVLERQAEALAFADRDIDAAIARRLQ